MKKLAAILGEPEHEVARLISKLERMNGYPSHDVRLLAGNIQKIRSKLQELGLDPQDTTGEELYGALLAKFERDSCAFDEHHAGAVESFDKKLAAAADIAGKYVNLPNGWSLKRTAAKNLLRQQPPRRVMKYLNYRSLESLLKRENVVEIFLASKLLESKTWQAGLKKSISKLDQTCFEASPYRFIALDSEKWQDADNGQNLVVQSPEVGAAAVWPDEISRHASLLSLVMTYADSFGIKDNQTKISQDYLAISWWADMDHLVAELGDEHVSMNLADIAMSALLRLPYDYRSLGHARRAVWNKLAAAYDNLPEIEAKFERDLVNSQQLRFRAPEPAYEFAEDF